MENHAYQKWPILIQLCVEVVADSTLQDFTKIPQERQLLQDHKVLLMELRVLAFANGVRKFLSWPTV